MRELTSASSKFQVEEVLNWQVWPYHSLERGQHLKGDDSSRATSIHAQDINPYD